jgi:hypothetical protein
MPTGSISRYLLESNPPLTCFQPRCAVTLRSQRHWLESQSLKWVYIMGLLGSGERVSSIGFDPLFFISTNDSYHLPPPSHTDRRFPLSLSPPSAVPLTLLNMQHTKSLSGSLVKSLRRRYPCRHSCCQSTFVRASDARRHEKEVHQDSIKFICPFPECLLRGFKRPYLLRDHINRCHQLLPLGRYYPCSSSGANS